MQKEKIEEISRLFQGVENPPPLSAPKGVKMLQRQPWKNCSLL